jgi:hypothetical protein
MDLFLLILSQIEVPVDFSWRWVVMIEATVIVSLAGFIAMVFRNYMRNYVPKQMYEDALNSLRSWEERCKNCEVARGETLKQIYILMAEMGTTLEMEVQATSAVKHLLEMMLWGGQKSGKDKA